MFPLHYALEWGAPLECVARLLAAHPAAAMCCKGEHAPVNRAIDTALSLFIRRFLSQSISEVELDVFLAEDDGQGSGRSHDCVAEYTTTSPQPPSEAKHTFLTALFRETIGILSTLFGHCGSSIVIVLHCANHIQAAATVVLARALRDPAVRVQNLHLGAKSLPRGDKFFCGVYGMIALASSLRTNQSLETMDLSCCALLKTGDVAFSQIDIQQIIQKFAAALREFNNSLHMLRLPFALEVKQESASWRTDGGRRSPVAISPAASLLRRCLQRNECLRSRVSARQRLCLAMALHPRLGVHSGNGSDSAAANGGDDGAIFRLLHIDLLDTIGNELLLIGIMEQGADRQVVRRYAAEPGTLGCAREKKRKHSVMND